MSSASSSDELRIELVESSFDKIKPQANEFVASFYQNLFKAHPEAQPLFKKTDMKKQEEKLLNSLVLLLENLRQPDLLAPVLKDLGARHKGYGTLPEYYPAVGETLLTTFAEYLQSEWTAETQQAWVDTYEVVTQLMLEGAGATAEVEKATVEKTSQTKSPDELRIERVESSFEKIKPQANEFVASFYENLLKTHPETEPLFNNTDMNKQYQKLLNSLVLLVENLRQPDVLAPILKDLGARQKGYGTLPEYYPAVGGALLTTFSEYLQSEWTAEIQQAWVDTYQAITDLMLEGATRVTDYDPIKTQKKSTTIKEKKEFKSFTKIFNIRSLFKPKKFLFDSYNSINNKVRYMLNQLLKIFWDLPTGVVAGGTALVLMALVLLVEENENNIIAKLLDQVETISILVALILYIKEIPENRKESHYQAWSTIDAAKGVKVSYARIMALQDLNEDRVPLRGLEAVDADLSRIKLPRADLSSSNLTKTILKEANLSRASFDNALLARADLSGANLSHTNFSFAKLSYVNFSLANLNHANLICADLRNAQMSGADLQNAQLSGANFDGVYLTGANLTGANVSESDLRGAYLKGAIMPDGSKHS